MKKEMFRAVISTDKNVFWRSSYQPFIFLKSEMEAILDNWLVYNQIKNPKAFKIEMESEIQNVDTSTMFIGSDGLVWFETGNGWDCADPRFV